MIRVSNKHDPSSSSTSNNRQNPRNNQHRDNEYDDAVDAHYPTRSTDTGHATMGSEAAASSSRTLYGERGADERRDSRDSDDFVDAGDNQVNASSDSKGSNMDMHHNASTETQMGDAVNDRNRSDRKTEFITGASSDDLRGMPRESEDALDDNYEFEVDWKIREKELEEAEKMEVIAKSVVPVHKFTVAAFVLYSLAFGFLAFYLLCVHVKTDEGKSKITVGVPFEGENPFMDIVALEMIGIILGLYLGGVFILTLMAKLLFAWSYIVEEMNG